MMVWLVVIILHTDVWNVELAETSKLVRLKFLICFIVSSFKLFTIYLEKTSYKAYSPHFKFPECSGRANGASGKPPERSGRANDASGKPPECSGRANDASGKPPERSRCVKSREMYYGFTARFFDKTTSE